LNAELGLIDEAKAVVDKWMARWISVVSAPYESLTLIKETETNMGLVNAN
jgi:hypothetical protein